jgi:hypothetical protein
MLTLTQVQFEDYKKVFPEDAKLQELTYEKLVSKVGNECDMSNIPFENRTETTQLLGGSALDCATGIGFVVYDCICLFIGAGGLRGSATKAEASAVGKAITPVLSEMEGFIKTLSEGGSASDTAWAIWGIIKTIYNGGCLGAVVAAFLNSLTWYNAILYSATALATIVAALATDGAAEVAAMVIQLATFGFLVSDSASAYDACFD